MLHPQHFKPHSSCRSAPGRRRKNGGWRGSCSAAKGRAGQSLARSPSPATPGEHPAPTHPGRAFQAAESEWNSGAVFWAHTHGADRDACEDWRGHGKGAGTAVPTGPCITQEHPMTVTARPGTSCPAPPRPPDMKA